MSSPTFASPRGVRREGETTFEQGAQLKTSSKIPNIAIALAITFGVLSSPATTQAQGEKPSVSPAQALANSNPQVNVGPFTVPLTFVSEAILAPPVTFTQTVVAARGRFDKAGALIIASQAPTSFSPMAQMGPTWHISNPWVDCSDCFTASLAIDTRYIQGGKQYTSTIVPLDDGWTVTPLADGFTVVLSRQWQGSEQSTDVRFKAVWKYKKNGKWVTEAHDYSTTLYRKDCPAEQPPVLVCKNGDELARFGGFADNGLPLVIPGNPSYEKQFQVPQGYNSFATIEMWRNEGHPEDPSSRGQNQPHETGDFAVNGAVVTRTQDVSPVDDVYITDTLSVMNLVEGQNTFKVTHTEVGQPNTGPNSFHFEVVICGGKTPPPPPPPPPDKTCTLTFVLGQSDQRGGYMGTATIAGASHAQGWKIEGLNGIIGKADAGTTGSISGYWAAGTYTGSLRYDGEWFTSQVCNFSVATPPPPETPKIIIEGNGKIACDRPTTLFGTQFLVRQGLSQMDSSLFFSEEQEFDGMVVTQTVSFLDISGNWHTQFFRGTMPVEMAKCPKMLYIPFMARAADPKPNQPCDEGIYLEGDAILSDGTRARPRTLFVREGTPNVYHFHKTWRAHSNVLFWTSDGRQVDGASFRRVEGSLPPHYDDNRGPGPVWTIAGNEISLNGRHTFVAHYYDRRFNPPILCTAGMDDHADP